MNIRKRIFCVGGLYAISCSLALADNMDVGTYLQGCHPVFSVQGGYASINAGGNNSSFGGSDTDIFTYSNSKKSKNTGFIGMFAGAEHVLPWLSSPALTFQAGVEYNSFGNMNIKGINTVGIEPVTATLYNYNYTFQTQQILGLFKLFVTTFERFHLYGEAGLGAAINQLSHYNPTTAQTGNINITPQFNNHSQTQFSYSLGLGVETDITKNVRIGVGYRYSNFGTPNLGNGLVTFGNYQAAVPFTIGNSNSYTNQFIARISYVI
jgi:opacity protein-like surface antigen